MNEKQMGEIASHAASAWYAADRLGKMIADIEQHDAGLGIHNLTAERARLGSMRKSLTDAAQIAATILSQ